MSAKLPSPHTSLSTHLSPHPSLHIPLHIPLSTHTPTRGNCILVGSLGQPLEPLARFALYLAGYSLQPLDTRGTAAFNDGLRTLLRQTGLEGKPTAVIVDVRCSLILPFCWGWGKAGNEADVLMHTVKISHSIWPLILLFIQLATATSL